MSLSYVLSSIVKNQLRRLAATMLRGRTSLGMDGDPQIITESLQSLAELLEEFKPRAADGRIIELGVGRTPDLMIAFTLSGATEVIGLDVDEWLSGEPVSQERFDRVNAALNKDLHADFLRVFAAGELPGIDIERCKQALRYLQYDGTNLPVEPGVADLIYSISVLEHVREDLVGSLIGSQLKALRPGGLVCHVIDLRDHCHIIGDHAEDGDWLDALRYSRLLHELMTDNRPAYINRIRAKRWEQIFRAAGLEILRVNTRHRPLPAKFDANQLHADFQLLDEDFSVAWLDIVARKK